MMFKQHNKHERLPALEYIGPNRLLCTVLDEMRECCKRLNFAPMGALIEEARILANRMEAALEDERDMRTLQREVTEMKNLRKELYNECEELLEQIDEKRATKPDSEDKAQDA